MDKNELIHHIVENQHFSKRIWIDEKNNGENSHFFFFVEQNAHLDVEFFITNVSTTINIECVLMGEHAHARIRCGYMLNKSHSIIINTTQHHQKAHTKSDLIVRGVLYEHAQSTYNGMIKVDSIARQSASSQEHKALLLSNNARALSIPALEVKTDDVRCFHASALGKFDQEQVFYAASRGLDVSRAEQLLLTAFFSEVAHEDIIKKLFIAL